MNGEQTEEQFIEQMPILVERAKLERRITHGILKLLLCDLEKLSCTFILELQRDLEEWYK